MSLPGDLTTTVLTGTYLDTAGVPQRGTVSLTPSAVLVDATGQVVIPQATRNYPLTGDGTFSTGPLVATNCTTITPQGWVYQVTVRIAGLTPQQFSILLPASTNPLDISAITPVVPQAAVASYLPQAGGTLTGTLTLNGSPPARIPAGATAGYVLTSDSSGNGSWQAVTGDKTFLQPFTASSTVTVTHNLGKYPAVTVFDSSGDQCEGSVVYTSTSALTVSFSAPFTGTVTCN